MVKHCLCFICSIRVLLLLLFLCVIFVVLGLFVLFVDIAVVIGFFLGGALAGACVQF